jgi:methylated-DNA-protein-cysteine methyltransferase related protein
MRTTLIALAGTQASRHHAARMASKRKATAQASSAAREIYAVVRAIPRGKVATYGQIGELIGIPAGHRVVARAMRSCPDRLPWHRVVGKKDARRARISVQDPEHAALQRELLAREGVGFDAAGYIPLKTAGWLPG